MKDHYQCSILRFVCYYYPNIYIYNIHIEYKYIVDGSALKLARAIRQSFCNMCSKYNFTEIRFPKSSVFCKYCTQKMCIYHLQDLTTTKIESPETIADYDEAKRQVLCCVGCRNPDLNNKEVWFLSVVIII